MSNRCFSRSVIAVVLVSASVSLGCDKQEPRIPTGPTQPAALSVKFVTPNSGPTGSAINISISGTGFAAGATATLGGDATDVTFVNSTLLTARTRMHAAGPVDVVVTNPSGVTSALRDGFTYVPVAITAISPSAGLGDNTIRISGTGFLAGATVTLDGVTAVASVLSNAVIRATPPLHAPGTVDVTVTNPGGQSGTLSSGYTYAVATVTASLSVVAARGPLSVSWTAPDGRLEADWVGLFKVGDSNEAYGWWDYTYGAAAGTLTLAAPAQPGQYEFRYLVNDGFVDAGRSSVVTVTADYPVHTRGHSAPACAKPACFLGHPEDWMRSRSISCCS